jgi:hypothetical protein
LDYDIPATLHPGQNYVVTITMENSGNNNWKRAENVSLKLYDVADNKYMSDVWGINNVTLPYDVDIAEKVILLFKITAPATAGVYNFRWAMNKENEFFGEYNTHLINVGGKVIKETGDPIKNNSEFISFRVADKMTAGEKIKVSLTLKNTGSDPWLPYSYSEYSVSPLTDSLEPKYSDWNSLPVFLSDVIEPGQVSSIEFYLTAPSNPGIYYLQYMMKKGNVFFGEMSNRAVITVSKNSISSNDSRSFKSSFLEQDVPSSMTHNKDYSVSITMTNTGNRTWIKGVEQLVMVDTDLTLQTLNSMNVGYIQLPHNVDPGTTVTFKFKVRPRETGWKYFRMMMMKEDGSLFGEPTQSVEIIVAKN